MLHIKTPFYNIGCDSRWKDTNILACLGANSDEQITWRHFSLRTATLLTCTKISWMCETNTYIFFVSSKSIVQLEQHATTFYFFSSCHFPISFSLVSPPSNVKQCWWNNCVHSRPASLALRCKWIITIACIIEGRKGITMVAGNCDLTKSRVWVEKREEKDKRKKIIYT